MRQARRIARLEAAIPDVDVFVGEFVRMDGVYAVVNVGPSTIPVRCAGFYPPVTGMLVQIQRAQGKHVLIGPAVQLEPLGIIKAAQTPKSTVTVKGKDYVLGMRSGYKPAVGDEVEINWVTGIIQDKITAAQIVEPPGTAPPPSTGFSGLLVQASSSGNWWVGGSRWNSADPWASTNNVGAWFYGSRVSDALAGAAITSAEIYLPASQSQGQISLGVHPHPAQPGGAPAISALTVMPGLSGWLPLPAGFAEALQSGSAAGIAVRSSNGFNKFRGVPSDALSGAMRFSGAR